MEKSFHYILVLAWMSFVLLSSCHNTPTRLISKSLDTDIKENENLDKNDKGYLVDLKNYKKEMSFKIDSVNQGIEIFKVRIENDEQNANYLKKVEAMEKNNITLKRKLSDYKEEGRTKWLQFKSEFNQNMVEMNYAFNSLTSNDVKRP